ncbi:MAG: B12-binding domain-containing radical SAM protein [Actinomycetota bacterium]|nr:B12-binding domain-containing radical SAM protein [Actinomycetota bacterium]
MKILLISPEYEDTFWNLKKVLRILGKRAAYPPLGLLTVAGLLPEEWDRKVVDLNCEKLTNEAIKWADFVFISAIVGQKNSTKQIIETIHKIGKPIVAGGPLFTTGWEEFSGKVEHIFIGEAENTFQEFINDVKNNSLKEFYESKSFPEISKAPIPKWELVNFRYYNSMAIQFSRGCPYNCEFCDVVHLNGKNPRLKGVDQLLAELDSLYQAGWHAAIFFVDDNFIGNKGRLKKEYLPALIEWQQKRKYPFTFSTQVSIDLADDPKLMRMLTEAGFATVFIGIETPNTESLMECGKRQNQDRDMVQSVKAIQNMGIEVNGGFIIGFDSDESSIFENQIEFIQKSGIVTSMVGLLNVFPKSRLHERLKQSNRLIDPDDNTSEISSLNFIPVMDSNQLIKGYMDVVSTIYSPSHYYPRIKTFLREFNPRRINTLTLRFYHIRALFASIWVLGMIQTGRHYYWQLLLWTLFRRPGLIPYAIGLPLGLIHFRSLSWVKQYDAYFRAI